MLGFVLVIDRLKLGSLQLVGAAACTRGGGDPDFDRKGRNLLVGTSMGQRPGRRHGVKPNHVVQGAGAGAAQLRAELRISLNAGAAGISRAHTVR
jgi:hypothetical protein